MSDPDGLYGASGVGFWPGDVATIDGGLGSADAQGDLGDTTPDAQGESDGGQLEDGTALGDDAVLQDTGSPDDASQAQEDTVDDDVVGPDAAIEDVMLDNSDSGPVCDPLSPPFCDGLKRVACASDGSAFVTLPCAPGSGCQDGQCVRPKPNVVLLVDSSASMNWVDSLNKDAGLCFSDACPPWDFPSCDDGPVPLTRLGKVKALVSALAATPAAAESHLALARFPQTLDDWGNCDRGYWSWNSEMTGDDDAHVTEDGGWFDEALSEVIAAPIAAGSDALSPWVDLVETTQSTGESCVNSWDCPSNNCIEDLCHAPKNPELRALGSTPLGKTLFYVGEYLRRHVLVEGKPCAADADCGTPSHTCKGGTCHDPFAKCRATAIVVFSDGSETEHVSPSDFFHPRVQSKRLRYGLGCAVDADCGAGSSCDGAVCRPTDPAIPWTGKSCEVSDLPCSDDSGCAPFNCGKVEPCPGICGPSAVTLTDGAGADRLTTWAGSPTSVTVHVVSASPVAGANVLTAAYGGGQYLTTDLTDPAAVLEGVLPLLDLKAPNPCVEP